MMRAAQSTTAVHRAAIDGSLAGDPFGEHHSENQQSRLSSPRDETCEGKMHITRTPYARRIRARSENVLRWGNREVAVAVQKVGEATYGGDDCKAKNFAEDAASSPRAAKNWLAAENPMSLTAFLNAYHANPTFKAWAKKILLLEQDHDPEFQAQLAQFVRAAQRLGSGTE